jgi:putative ABC transport system permease protein
MNLFSALRLALRQLSRRPVFSTTSVLTLALGVAATTTVFTLVYGTLLRPLPFRDTGRLAVIYRTAEQAGRPPALQRWSFPRLELLRQTSHSFENMGAFGRAELSIGGDDRDPDLVAAEVVSPDYFTTLDVAAEIGRTFRPDENLTPGTHPVAILAHSLWLRRYAGETAVVGRTVRIQNEPVTIVGVMKPGFNGLTGRAELWIPQMMGPRLTYAEFLTTDQNFISAIGRLRPGMSFEQARADLAGVGRNIEVALPDETDVPTDWAATAVPLDEARIDPASRRSVLLLFAAVLFLLLLACANLSGLGIAQGVTRRREIAVRLALGARRRNIVRQLLSESTVLGVAGAGLGIILAWTGVRLLSTPASSFAPGNMYGVLGEFATARIDVRVLGFALLVSLVSIVLSGLLPALHAGRTDLALEFRERGGGPGRRAIGMRPQSVLVVIEVALALSLSIGSGLLFTSLRQLESRSPGFRPDHLLTFRIRPSEVRYEPPRAPAIIGRVLEAVTAVAGVRSATVDACAPFDQNCANNVLFIEGREPPSPGQAPFITRHYVGQDHFSTLGIPLLRGRAFTPDDRAGRPGVAIINQTAARRFWPDEDPIGQHIWFDGSGFSSPDSSAEIVGIVGDVQYGPVERGQPPSVYTPYRQFTYPSRLVTVRTDAAPLTLVPAIRTAVGTVDDLPISDVRTMEERLGDAWARPRFNARLMGAFALIAVLLAAIGIHGIIANSVSQRIREMGIRLAIGATPGRVLGMVVGRAMLLALTGVGAGILGAFALTRFMRALLFDVSAVDPVVYATQAAILFVAAFLASWLPARRAAGVDPAGTLRAD